MSKISGYANSVSALGTDDLLDVSEKISSSPDVYESRKMTGATLATFIQNYTNDSIYSASGTVPSSVVATLTDTLTFKGNNTSSASSNIKIVNSASASLWDFRNNGNVEIGQFTTLKSSKNVTGSDTIFEINASNNRSSILVVSDTAGYNGIQIASYGSTASGATANKLGIAGGLNVGQLVLMNRGNGVKDAEVWFSIGEGSASDWADTNTTAKFDVNTFYVNNGKSLIVGTGATPTVDASAALEVVSTTKGLLFPRMTTTQKNAITTPAAGLTVFDTTLTKLCVYTGAAWETVTSV